MIHGGRKGEKEKIGGLLYDQGRRGDQGGKKMHRCHLKCHPIETAACLCFAALRLFPSVHISDLDPFLACDRYQKKKNT